MTKRRNNKHNGHPNKRHQEGDNARQLDPVFGQYRALPVSEDIIASVTPDTIPTDGETYLAMVRKQAETGSTVMFVPRDIDYDESEEQVTEQQTPIDRAPFRDLSSFKDIVLEEFTKQRDNLPEPGTLPIPDDFIFPESFTAWRAYVMSHEPSLHLVSNLDKELTLRLVVYSTRWLAASTPAQISNWIYSLLVRVPEVMDHSDVSVVRELGVRAKKFHDRDELPQDTRILCATILCIVGDFFNQRDLFL